VSIAKFVQRHRQEIDRIILSGHGMRNYRHKISDDDRKKWVLNDDYLYRWARREGVKA